MTAKPADIRKCMDPACPLCQTGEVVGKGPASNPDTTEAEARGVRRGLERAARYHDTLASAYERTGVHHKAFSNRGDATAIRALGDDDA